MESSAVRTDIFAHVSHRQDEAIKAEIQFLKPAEIAAMFKEIDDFEDQAYFFQLIPAELETEVFDYLNVNQQLALLNSFDEAHKRFILNTMSPDDRTTLFSTVNSRDSVRFINLLDVENRTVALNLLGYPINSTGRLMTPWYIAVQKNWTVQETLDYIRKFGKTSETLNHIYVTDPEGHLIDDIIVSEFLLASPNEKVEALMDYKFLALDSYGDQETDVDVFRKNNRIALPVVNREGILVGIVTVDDILDVVNEENTEDIQKLGGSEPLDAPYLEISLMSLYKKRVVWLIVLFIGEMLTASAMGAFQDEIAKAVVLSLFVPLIISSGGNSGSQAATLIIRAMALGEIKIKDWYRVIKRELITGALLGVSLGIIGFLRIALWSLFSNIYGPHWMLVGITVGFTVIGVVLWGTISGSMLPLLLKRCGLDPATSSAPFVATIVDVTGLVIYFSIAMFILKGTVL